jgi:hypothetical protein
MKVRRAGREDEETLERLEAIMVFMSDTMRCTATLACMLTAGSC